MHWRQSLCTGAGGGAGGWPVALPVALGLAVGGAAGVWFWVFPFNYSLWHLGAGVGVVGVLGALGGALALGRAGTVAGGCTVAVAVASVLAAGASGAMGAVLAVGWLLALAWGVGDSVLHRLGEREALNNLAGRVTLAMALGLGALAYAVLGLGLAGLLRPAPVWGCLLLLTLLLASAWARLAGDLLQAWRAVRARWTAGDGLFRVWVAVLSLCLFGAWLWALAPSVWYDELNYQVAAPATYARLGAIVDYPEEFRFLWAHNANMLFTLGLVLGGAPAAKLVHFALGLLAALAAFALGRQAFGVRIGALAALLFLALPLVSWELGVAYVDLAVTFFCAAALVAAVLTTRKGNLAGATLTGALAGLAVGTKLNAGLLVVPLGAMLVGVWWRQLGWRRALLGGLAFGVAMGAVVAPWLVRDWAWTGNPVFPFFNHLFDSPRWETDAGMQNWHLFGQRTGLLAALLLPWDLVVHAGAFGEGLGPGVAGALLWLGLPWCAMGQRSQARKAALLAWGVILPACVLTLAVSQYLRFLLPLAVPLAAVAAVNLDEAWRWGAAHRPRLAVLVALGLGLTYLGGSRLAHLAMLWPLPERFPVGVAFGLESREAFLERTVREYRAMRQLEALVGDDAKVVSVGCHARLYTRARLYEAAWGKHELRDILDTQAHGAELAAALAERGFRAMIVAREVVEASGWQSLPVLQRSFLEDHAALAFAHWGVEVYLLSPTPTSRQAAAPNLLANPGFEDLESSSLPRSWFPYGAPRLGEGLGRSGSRGVLADRSNGLTQPVPVQVGSSYTLVHWSRADHQNQAARLQVNWLSEHGEMVGVSLEVVPAGQAWQRHLLTAVAPPGTRTANVYVSVHEDSQVWFDDFCLVRGTDTTQCGGTQ